MSNINIWIIYFATCINVQIPYYKNIFILSTKKLQNVSKFLSEQFYLDTRRSIERYNYYVILSISIAETSTHSKSSLMSSRYI